MWPSTVIGFAPVAPSGFWCFCCFCGCFWATLVKPTLAAFDFPKCLHCFSCCFRCCLLLCCFVFLVCAAAVAAFGASFAAFAAFADPVGVFSCFAADWCYLCGGLYNLLLLVRFLLFVLSVVVAALLVSAGLFLLVCFFCFVCCFCFFVLLFLLFVLLLLLLRLLLGRRPLNPTLAAFDLPKCVYCFSCCFLMFFSCLCCLCGFCCLCFLLFWLLFLLFVLLLSVAFAAGCVLLLLLLFGPPTVELPLAAFDLPKCLCCFCCFLCCFCHFLLLCDADFSCCVLFFLLFVLLLLPLLRFNVASFFPSDVESRRPIAGFLSVGMTVSFQFLCCSFLQCLKTRCTTCLRSRTLAIITIIVFVLKVTV